MYQFSLHSFRNHTANVTRILINFQSNASMLINIASFTFYIKSYQIRFQFKQVQICGTFSMTNLNFENVDLTELLIMYMFLV